MAMRAYVDFDLRIRAAPGGSPRVYPTEVLRSAGGDAEGTLRPPHQGEDLARALRVIGGVLARTGRGVEPEPGDSGEATPSGRERSVRAFGAAWFDALFRDEIRARYDVSRQLARADGRGLRVRLIVEPPELAAIPWECLYDSRDAEYLCLSTKTPRVRYLAEQGG